MFGYVRPCRPEMKCKEFDLYRATYCGLCRCLRDKYGFLPPMFLSYDFTFLALLLWEAEEGFHPCAGRCHMKPWAKKAMCPVCPALERTADASVILTYWKLQDSVADERGGKKLAALLLAAMMKPAYRKAAAARPDFDRSAQEHLSRLSRLEGEQCPSIDRTADAFACLLRDAAEGNGEQGRVLEQILYHVGRWIYLVDARDDLEEDRKQGKYNPLLLRYGQDADDAALEDTMLHSLEMAASALQLGQFGCRMPVLENILYLGLPLVQKAVFNGSWSQIKNQKIWSNDT